MILLFSIIASFIGSLQLGPVNLSVIDTAIHQNRKNAFWVAVGGSLPEFIYCFLAVFAGSFLINNPFLFKILKAVIASILIILAFFYFFKKNKKTNILDAKTNTSKTNLLKNFSKGFSLGILNPQLMPFWLSVQVLFNSYSFLVIDEKIDYFFFILGAGMGAFLLLISIAFTITRYKDLIMRFLSNNLYNRILGILFLLIGLQQIYSLYHD
ncbi:MAG: LysE family transporter [Raineya sp.]|jgi:threonine/homoserine/homoserine lactone efflux protein|nr:LysE family transporter [Raineya sp.]